jgi:large subunit ribosomal protein L21
MFAVFKSGGKQYKVADGNVVDLELISHSLKAGDVIDMQEVICAQLADGSALYGQDSCNKKVSLALEVQNIYKDEKKIVFYKQRRQNHRRKKGHRQILVRVEVKLRQI